MRATIHANRVPDQHARPRAGHGPRVVSARDPRTARDAGVRAGVPRQRAPLPDPLLARAVDAARRGPGRHRLTDRLGRTGNRDPHDDRPVGCRTAGGRCAAGARRRAGRGVGRRATLPRAPSGEPHPIRARADRPVAALSARRRAHPEHRLRSGRKAQPPGPLPQPVPPRSGPGVHLLPPGRVLQWAQEPRGTPDHRSARLPRVGLHQRQLPAGPRRELPSQPHRRQARRQLAPQERRAITEPIRTRSSSREAPPGPTWPRCARSPRTIPGSNPGSRRPTRPSPPRSGSTATTARPPRATRSRRPPRTTCGPTRHRSW